MAKRVLVFTNHYFPEHFKINDLVNWLIEENYEVRVVTGLPNYPNGKIYKGYGLFSKKSFEKRNQLRINRLPLLPRGNGSKAMLIFNYVSFFFSSMLFTLYLLIFKKKYEVVIVHHTSPFFIAIPPIIYRFFKSSKNLIWDLDIWPETLSAMKVINNKFIYNIIKFIVKFAYSNYDQILVSSNALVDLVKERALNKKVTYFPNWADGSIEKKYSYKSTIESDSNSLKIMYIGNIGEAQNFDEVITSIKLLKDENIKWIFVGGGRFKHNFVKQVDEYKLKSKVEFIDYLNINDVPSISSKSDLLFLTLNDRGIFKSTIPAKLQTYMCLGKPILAMISGETKKLINDNKIGIAVDSGDYLKLVKEIKSILLNKHDLNLYSSNAKKIYFSKFKSDLRRNQFLKILKNL